MVKKNRFKQAKRLICLTLGCAMSVNAIAQGFTVSGKVVDKSNEPLVGVNIIIKGSTTGVVSGSDGTYAINVPSESAVIVASYLGMATREIAVGNQRTINITLEDQGSALDDVVVIGYGTVRKRDLTGSVASVRSGDVSAIPGSDPLKAIQGRVAGMDIVSTSGDPGAEVEILIRGSRSINASNRPLFIIDGIQGGSYEDVNPNDIESIEILKDASSTAIYGSQGANGVVLITTKKGVEGKTSVTYDGYYGVNALSKYPSVLTGDAWIQMRKDAYATNGITDESVIFSAAELEAISKGQWVNWLDELTQTGTQQRHSVSVRGGNEKTKSFISSSYFKEEGLLRNNTAERFTARVNVDRTIGKWVKTGMYSQLAYRNRDKRQASVMNNAISTLPLGVPYDDEGNVVLYPIPGQPTTLSPLADNRENMAVSQVKRINTSVKAYVDVAPVEWINFRSSAGGTFEFSRSGAYNDATSISQSSTKRSSTSVENSNEQFYTWDNVLNIKKQFDVHGLTLTALTSYTKKVNEEYSMAAPDQQVASYLFYNIAAADPTQANLSSEYTGSETMSYAGRLDYNLAGKYLLTASLRADGASQLAEGNKWAYFPSVAAAWRIVDEPFMQSVKQISELKLRASYGITGNAAVDPYATQSSLEPGDKMGFGDIYASTYKYTRLLGNKDLTWETSATVDVGLDFSMFKNRLNLTADFYSTNTKDLLMLRTLPSSSGGDGKDPFQMWQNVGKTSNTGLELTLNTVNIQQPGHDGFSWTSALTFSVNKEKIVEMYEGDIIVDEVASLLVGYPIRSFYGYKVDGIWQTDEASEAARWRYEDKEVAPGDIKIANIADVDTAPNRIDRTNDWTYLGQASPKWLLGFNNTLTYKGFDLNLYMLVRWGQMIDYDLAGRYDPTGANGQPGNYNYWTPTNPSNDYPAANSQKPLLNYVGYRSLSFIDGSYFKLKTVTLGYTVPENLTSKIGVNKLRVYFTANNLLTITKSHLLEDYDPERGLPSVTRQGGSTDNYLLPMTRQYVFGINVEL
jgi:TonB-linked SusC/RagA family outer membrane protein